MAKKHAILSPSAADRWLNCTPSARLEAEYPEQTSSYALEGTIAHALAENILADSSIGIGNIFEQSDLDTYLTDEMKQYVDDYVNYVRERLTGIRAEDPMALILIEERIDLREWVPEGFGTGDVVIIGANKLLFIDLKYGKGKKVDAYQNKQLMLYALGAYSEHSDIQRIDSVEMVIYQPRMDNISSYELPISELLAFGENELKVKAKLAFNGEGEFVPGKHCQFCKVENCRARLEGALETAVKAFELVEKMPTVDISEVAAILPRIELAEAAFSTLTGFALKQAIAGTNIPGYKLVEGRSVRKISDELKAVELLKAEGLSEDEYLNYKLKGIGDLEKALKPKKLDAVLGNLIIKPKGAPTLAPLSDKRSVYVADSAAEAFKDIEIDD